MCQCVILEMRAHLWGSDLQFSQYAMSPQSYCLTLPSYFTDMKFRFEWKCLGCVCVGGGGWIKDREQDTHTHFQALRPSPCTPSDVTGQIVLTPR